MEVERSELDFFTNPNITDPILSTTKSTYMPLGSLDNDGPVSV